MIETAADLGPVLKVRTPITIRYRYSAGPNSSSHLAGLLEGRLIGNRCPSCTLVYFPPRNGTCPKCARALAEEVEVGPRGTITTFCVVNVPFLGQKIPIPYVAASIKLDAADMSVSHLVLGCDAAEVRIGMRVEPVWKDRGEWGPTLENIDHFRPTGEPDLDIEAGDR
jgi:uncharacterized protein